MVICCSFPSTYSNPLFPRHLQRSPFSQRTQHLRRLGQQMKKTKVCVTLGTEWNFLVLFFQTEAI